MVYKYNACNVLTHKYYQCEHISNYILYQYEVGHTTNIRLNKIIHFCFVQINNVLKHVFFIHRNMLCFVLVKINLSSK